MLKLKVPYIKSTIIQTTKICTVTGVYTLHGTHSAAICWTQLTAVSRRLQAVLGHGAPAHWKDVPRVVLAPVVEGTPPAIERDEDLIALHLPDGSGADQVGVLSVHSF